MPVISENLGRITQQKLRPWPSLTGLSPFSDFPLCLPLSVSGLTLFSVLHISAFPRLLYVVHCRCGEGWSIQKLTGDFHIWSELNKVTPLDSMITW